jgi:hypothetical protein
MLLRPSELTGPLRNYESYRRAQVSLLKQQRVIDIALVSPEWRALNRAATGDQARDFLHHLRVVAPAHDEIIRVTFTDRDPKACAAAVKGVLRAYSAIYVEREQLEQEERVKQLSAIRISIASERDAKREAIRSIAREFGTDDLRPIHQARQSALTQLEVELRQIEAKLAGADAEPAAARQQLEASRKRYQELIQSLQSECKVLGLKMLDIERLRQEEKEKDASVAEVARRIETLQTEAKAAGRIEVVSWGEPPELHDGRRPLFSAIGGAAGLLLGMALATAVRRVCRRRA